jgi:membrane-associated protease RseP (regulator of RpoE activity)
MGKFALFCTICFAGWVLSVLWVVVDGVLAKILHFAVERYSINIGPKLFEVRFAGGILRVNWFPLGSFIKFKDFKLDPRWGSVEPAEEALAPADKFGSQPDYLNYSEHPRWKRALSVMAAPLLTILICSLIVGENVSARTICGTFPWLGQMTLSPRSNGGRIVAGFFLDLRQHGIVYGAAVFGIVMSFLNCLPLGALRGGLFIKSFIKPGRPSYSKVEAIWNVTGILMLMVFMVITWTAYISYLCNSSLP